MEKCNVVEDGRTPEKQADIEKDACVKVAGTITVEDKTENSSDDNQDDKE